METIAPEQLKLLKRLSKTYKIELSELRDEDVSTYKFLNSLGYVDFEKNSTGVNYHGEKRPEVFKSVSISEYGKAYLYDNRRTFFRFVIPVTISLCALILSVISILTVWTPH